ncbi:cation diffusion facilitator family transporter [Mangrovicoccus algicola]|uniref:Protein p34 n=1 Tax=Mangrovicoccus algicola TaxID=2771008 RepID=A0A8J6YZ39_9RHOB|nr:cation diffusion facilitator family transporter [Mangrovicoccus algicola]MBE3638706.1 cation transporter [Mangrovicoccus algicola]
MPPPDAYPPQLLRQARLSIAVALAVLALKVVAWRMTGSVALYSDALESIVNVVTAVAACLALSYASRPADENHPYGHQKVEYLSAVLEGALIMIAAAMIVMDAVAALLRPQVPDLSPLAIGFSLAATALNWLWARQLIRRGRAARSPALEADGHHLMSDVVTTGGVLAGLGLAWGTGWPVLDPLLALAVTGHIVVQGWGVIRGSLAGLLDEAVGEEEQERIAAIIEASAAGALELHDLVTRRAGPVTFIEFHLIMPGAMTVRDSHAICDRVEKALRREDRGARVIIHVEPEEMTEPEGRLIG